MGDDDGEDNHLTDDGINRGVAGGRKRALDSGRESVRPGQD